MMPALGSGNNLGVTQISWRYPNLRIPNKATNGLFHAPCGPVEQSGIGPVRAYRNEFQALRD